MKIIPNKTFQNVYFKHHNGFHYKSFHIIDKDEKGCWQIKYSRDKMESFRCYDDKALEYYFKTGTWQKITKQEYYEDFT